MAISDILVYADPTATSAERLDIAFRLVRVRLWRLTCRAADGPAQPEMTRSRRTWRRIVLARTEACDA